MKVTVEYDYCDEYTGVQPSSCVMELPTGSDPVEWMNEEFPREGTNSDGLDCNYLNPRVLNSKGEEICSRDDSDIPLYENTKVTLTFAQLKRLVQESDDGTFDDNAKLLQKEIEKVIADKARSWEEAGAVLPFGMERNLARAILEHLYLDWSFKPLSGIPSHTPSHLDETAKRPNKHKMSRGKTS